MTESAFTKKTRLCGMLFTEISSATGWNQYWKSTRVILEENVIPIYIKWRVILQSDTRYKEWISFTFLAFPHSTFQSFRGFKIAVRNRSRLPKCVGEMTFCLARKSIGFLASTSSLFAGTVTPLKTIFGHLKQLNEVNVVIFPVDLWSLNIDSYQGPVSQKPRNFLGLSRVPQVSLYLRIAEVLSQ